MREDYDPAITDVVMKLESSMGAIRFKVGNCVSDGQARHFSMAMKTMSATFLLFFLFLARGGSGREVEIIKAMKAWCMKRTWHASWAFVAIKVRQMPAC